MGPSIKWSDLPRLNPNAAGLDISAREIVACVPQGRCDPPIRVFGTYTPDVHALAAWLKECGVDTVAMEATGVYWIAVYEVLQQAGLCPLLVNARHVKNVPGRKSDVSDAQWIQTLHTYGLLRGSFLPEAQWRTLRTYWRQRASLIEHRAPHIQHMAKALHHMNLRLPEVITDITGVTGMKIVRAIIDGERDPVKLAYFRDPRCAHSVEDIVKALTGKYQDEQIFILKQAVALYDFYTAQITECDAAIEREYSRIPDAPDQDQRPPVDRTRRRHSRARNAPSFDLRAHLYRVTGVDLVAVTGLEESTVQSVLSETGTDVTRWRTVKHFSSWLGLAPHNDITGGKVLHSHVLKTHNRAGQAFRLAAQSVTRSNSAFGAFYRRVAFRLGAEQAIVATAHKIARTVYAILRDKKPFHEMGADEYERLHRERVVHNLTRKAQSLGFTLQPIPATQ